MKNEFWEFERARDFVRSLGLKTTKEWKEYCKSGKTPKEIPITSNIVYKNKWIDIYDWLGVSKEEYKLNKKTCRKYNVNHDFFKVWSNDMAYVLGFWWADGWICNDHFCISQEKSRKYILKSILEKMESNYPIRQREWGTCYFSIQSKIINKDIIGLGGKERKSRDIKFPNVPKEFLKDFIRGYFDGDGCICKFKDKRRTKRSGKNKFNYISSFTSGSVDFINGLLMALKENIDGFIGKIQEKRPVTKTVDKVVWKSKICYVINCGMNDTRRLRSFIYDENNKSELKLIEKYEKFNGIGEICGGYLTKDFISFKEAKNIAHKNLIKTEYEWKSHARKNEFLPMTPKKVYKSEWHGWDDFLGKRE